MLPRFRIHFMSARDVPMSMLFEAVDSSEAEKKFRSLKGQTVIVHLSKEVISAPDRDHGKKLIGIKRIGGCR